MYKIVPFINAYHGKKQYKLVSDGVIIVTSISDKNIAKFQSKGIAFDDSEGIKNYLKYYNL